MLSKRQIRVLREYAISGSMKEAGHRLGINEQTVKNYLYEAHRELGVTSTVAAYRVLGWLRLPSDAALIADDVDRLTESVEALRRETERFTSARRVA